MVSKPHVPAEFATDELLALLDAGVLDGAMDEATDDATEDATDALLAAELPQAEPLITGISAAAAPLVPCIPISTDWLGWIVRFQLRLVAV